MGKVRFNSIFGVKNRRLKILHFELFYRLYTHIARGLRGEGDADVQPRRHQRLTLNTRESYTYKK